MKRSCSCYLVILLLAFAIQPLCTPASAQDTDGDGLLDLIDVPGFDPGATGEGRFVSKRIEDLDGANLLTNLRDLNLNSNRITSIERGDFDGLTNLQSLSSVRQSDREHRTW